MQSTNNPYNKTMLMAGILTIVLGIILGVITIIINLNKYVNNINRYTEENKYTIEAKITENDNNYNSYVDEIKSLNEDKLLYQKELATFSKKDYVSKEYKEIEQKITNINAKLEKNQTVILFDYNTNKVFDKSKTYTVKVGEDNEV